MASLRILEVSKVTPSSHSPTSAGEFSLPLTFFDTFWFKLAPVERIFFYHLPDSDPHSFNSVILPKLKNSVSLALSHFLPLAGNLTWPSPHAAKPIIRYTPQDGVLLTITESDGDFNRLSGYEAHEAIELHALVPQLMVSDNSAAVMALQITQFPNKGFCIGITTHHSILDGKSATMFVKSWAYICKQCDQESPSILPTELSPFFDRSIIKDPAGLEMLYLNQWLAFTSSDSDPNKKSLKVSQNLGVLPPNFVRATFQLTCQNIKKLRETILSKRDSTKPIHLSTFVLALAHTITCMVKARGGESDRIVVWRFSADYRARLEPPVPENYFGNCVGTKGQEGKARDFLDENGLAFIAEKLSQDIEGLKKGQLFEGAEHKLIEYWEFVKEGLEIITVAGSPRFEVYGSNFGWGRPKKVEIVSIDRSGAISLAESGDGNGGVEVGFALEKHEMEIFASLFNRELVDVEGACLVPNGEKHVNSQI